MGNSTLEESASSADVFLPTNDFQVQNMARRTGKLVLSHEERISAGLNNLERVIEEGSTHRVVISLGQEFYNASDATYISDHLSVDDVEGECIVFPSDQMRVLSKDLGEIMLGFLHPNDTRDKFKLASPPHFFYRRDRTTGISLLKTTAEEIEGIVLLPRVGA